MIVWRHMEEVIAGGVDGVKVEIAVSDDGKIYLTIAVSTDLPLADNEENDPPEYRYVVKDKELTLPPNK